MRLTLGPLVASAALCASAAAQSFNIDIGNATPAPSSAYGAAANQAGVWNVYTGGTLNNLQDLGGNSTSVSLTGTGGILGGFNDPGTFGDDEALMDDGMVVPFMETYTLSGLAAGSYSVYLYSWTVSNLPTGYNVNNTGFQTVGGAWPGGHVAGVTYLAYNVNIAQGQDIIITVHSVDGALGAFGGLQVVQVPAPGAAAALLGGFLARGGRRRR
ncbi:MAG: hypothetical protein U0636_07450 [Phycisphaerales bacterium]